MGQEWLFQQRTHATIEEEQYTGLDLGEQPSWMDNNTIISADCLIASWLVMNLHDSDLWILTFKNWMWNPHSCTTFSISTLNTLRPRQNGRHFPNNTFKCIFLFENVWIWIKISQKFVPKVRINNIPALVQIMAWHRIGNKLLSEPMMVNLLTHICVTRPQWVDFLFLCYLLGTWREK